MSELPSYKTKPGRRAKPAKHISEQKRQNWSVKEMRLLASGLEKHGFAHVSKIAAEIGTRSESEVSYFMQRWCNRVYKKNTGENENPLYKLFSKKHANEIKNYQSFPPIALWKKVVSNLKQPRFRGADYNNIFADLFRQFAEEEEPYLFEGFPNFKRIYEYLAYTLDGGIPPVTSAEDNLILNYLMYDMKQFIDKNDLREEKEFLQNFLGPHQFVPSHHGTGNFDFQVINDYINENEDLSHSDDVEMEEAGPSGTSQNQVDSSCGKDVSIADGSSDQIDKCTKKKQSSSEKNRDFFINVLRKKEYPKDVDYIPKGDTIEVPAHLYNLYKLHQEIQNSINPMIIPVWMQEAEQKLIHDYYESLEPRPGGSGNN